MPRRPCVDYPCPLPAVPGKPRLLFLPQDRLRGTTAHEVERQRVKWRSNPSRDMGYRRLKRLVVLPVPCAICAQDITPSATMARRTRSTTSHLGPKRRATIRRTYVTHTRAATAVVAAARAWRRGAGDRPGRDPCRQRPPPPRSGCV